MNKAMFTKGKNIQFALFTGIMNQANITIYSRLAYKLTVAEYYQLSLFTIMVYPILAVQIFIAKIIKPTQSLDVFSRTEQSC